MQPLDPITGRALDVAQKVGLVQALSGRSLSLEEVSSATGCASRGVEALLWILTSAGYLEVEHDRFAAASELESYLAGRWAEEWSAFPEIPEYLAMEEAVRTGTPVRVAVESSEDEGEFYQGMTPALFELHWPDALALADRIDSNLKTVLDLGAGSAVWSLALAKSRPEVRVVAVDRQRVLEHVTQEFVQQHGAMMQYELRPGDYHQVALEEESFDLVLLGHLLHADGWEGSRALLQRCKAALKPGGQLAVAEFVAPEPRWSDYAAAVFHLNMVMLTENGVVFTGSELEELVRQAGFQGLAWVQGPGDYPVLLASNL